MRPMTVALAAIAMLTGACAANNATESALSAKSEQQVFIVRHLEKGPGEDPALTLQGRARAQRLAQLLSSAPIAAVFATPTRRALETAKPVADRHYLPISTYDPRNPDPLVRSVLAGPGSVLIVGHSNTVPDLVERFGGPRPEAIGDDDYGTVFIVVPSTRKVRTVEVPSGG